MQKTYYQIIAIDIPKDNESVHGEYLVDKMQTVCFFYDTALNALSYVETMKDHKTQILIREISVFSDCSHYNLSITYKELLEKVKVEVFYLNEKNERDMLIEASKKNNDKD